MIKDNRIDSICGEVSAKFVVDVGADHGYFTKKLFDEKKISKAVVTDISAKCLKKAENNLKEYKDKIVFQVTDGLQGICEKSKTFFGNNSCQVLICGMGGKEIIKILTADESKYFSNFILEPQKNVSEVRNFLLKNCFNIHKDYIVKADKMYYNILCVQRDFHLQTLTQDEIDFGVTNLQTFSPDFVAYLRFLQDYYKQILEKKKVEKIEKKLNQIKRILGEKNV